MTDDIFDPDHPENISGEENFADLFESYMSEQEDLRVGDKIRAEIIAIGDKNIFIHIGAKSDGVVDKAEMLDDQNALTVQVGDFLDLYVVSVKEGEIRLSKSISGAGGDQVLQDAFRNRIPVQGKVTESCKGGFRVGIMQKTAFCPISQMDTKYVENPEGYIGATFDFLITKFEEKGRNIVVSRRDLLKEQQEAAKKDFFQTAAIGDIVDVTVSSIKPYGAFVELLPGLEGLIHISELAWSRVGHPDEVVSVNERIKAKILEMDPVKGKISLSARQAAADPWDTVSEKFKTGDKITGKVTRCADFGAFVEIAPGIEGLVHVSEMSYLKRVMRADDVVSPGDTVPVTVKDVDPVHRRISLSMKDAEGDPWMGIEKKYAKGQICGGTIEKKEAFGYFITLEPGVVGLLPKSKINSAPNVSEIERLKISDPITVKVEEIDPVSRKISLGVEGGGDDWKKFAPAGDAPVSGAMGNLGEKLRSALGSKK